MNTHMRLDKNILPLFAYYCTAHQEYDNLNIIFKCTTPGSVITVIRTPGRIDFTHIQGIKRIYKKTIVLYPLEFSKLSMYEFISILKNATIDIKFTLWIGVNTTCTSTHIQNNKIKCVQRITAHPHKYKRLEHIRNFSVSELLSLRIAISEYLKSSREQSIANARLYAMLQRAYNIKYSTHLTIRIPYSPYVSKQHVTATINTHIASLQLPTQYKESSNIKCESS